jgi:hypothetical protein
MSTLREADRAHLSSLLLRLVVALQILIYFGAALLHSGVHIPLGPLVLAVPKPILPATIVETLLSLSAIINFIVLMRTSRSSARITLGIQLFQLAGIALGMVALLLRVGPPPSPDWTIHYAMLAAIAAVMVLLAMGRARA